MGQEFLQCCCISSACIQLALIITVASMSIRFYNHEYSNTVQIPNTDYFNQVANDWNVLPFTDVQIFDASTTYQCPDDYPEPLFEYFWLGTDTACDCTGIYSEWIRWPDEFALGKTCGYNETIYGCFVSPPLPPIFSSTFQDKLICGKQGFQPFLNITRPSGPNQQCPDGQNACSNQTSSENTVCYDPQTTNHDSCPITALNFTKISNSNVYLNKKLTTQSDQVQLIQFNSTHNLAYSKYVDSLPITTTRVGNYQCEDPFQFSGAQVNTYNYPADFRGQNYQCRSQPNYYAMDTRYMDIGFAVNEYELKEQNGLNQIYEYFRASQRHQPPYYAMQRNNYNFQVRPTIGYSLSCEAQGKTREQAYESFQTRINFPVNGQALMAYRLGISLIVISLCGFWLIFIGIDDSIEVMSCGSFCWMTCMFGMYLPLILAYQKDMNIINDFLDSLKDASWTMQCVDPLSFIGSVDFIQGGYGNVTSKYKAELVMLYTCLGLYIAAQIVFFCVAGCANCNCSRRQPEKLPVEAEFSEVNQADTYGKEPTGDEDDYYKNVDAPPAKYEKYM